MEVLKVRPSDILDVENAQLLPAIGAALASSSAKKSYSLKTLIELLKSFQTQTATVQNRLPALFDDEKAYQNWESARSQQKIERIDIAQLNGNKLFLGVDSGSTTTKLVLIDDRDRVVFDYYVNNRGNAIKAVQTGLEEIRELFDSNRKSPKIVKSVVTGYGEDLIRAAYGFDDGMVETLAHFRAAKAFDKQVSFILDIGGQDMKAIFVKDGFIQNIEINEACSSNRLPVPWDTTWLTLPKKLVRQRRPVTWEPVVRFS